MKTNRASRSLLESPPEKVLVIFPNWVGDAIMAMPALGALRRNLPYARLTLLMRPYVAGVVEGAPWHDNIIEYDSKMKTPTNIHRVTKALRGGKFDVAIVLPNSLSAAIVARLSEIPRRVGYSRNARRFLLTDAIPTEKENGRFKPTYMVDYYMAILDYLGLDTSERRIRLFTTPESEQRAHEILTKHGINPDRPFIVVNPGAAFGSSKLWPAEYFAKLCDLIAEEFGMQLLLTPGPKEDDIAGTICSLMKHTCRIIPSAEGNLHILKSIILRSKILITNDTGARHIAVAFDIPTVVLMGPTDPRYTNSPYETGAVIRAGVDCSPCHLKKCPTDHRCMREILPQVVFGKVAEILGTKTCFEKSHRHLSSGVLSPGHEQSCDPSGETTE